MKYEYYNPPYENMNCIIRSISKALDKKPEDVEKELLSISKDYRKEKVWEKYLSKHTFYIVDTYKNKNLLITNLEGVNIVYAKSKDWHHLVCVIDNKVFDKASLDDLSNMTILKVYKLR